ncbi:MAG: polysaccharide biosynthesis/export family protein [Elusimicrobiota bacterium]
MLRALSVVLIAALAAACGPLRVVPSEPAAAAASAKQSQSEQAEAAALAAAVQQANAKKSDYLLSGADLIQISVFGEKDMDRQVRVSQNGTITYPLIGSVKVGGLTTADAEAALAKGLKDYLRDPQVTVFIKEYGNKKVFVFGQVKKPGAVELPTETKLTVLEAISQSEGFTPIAAPDRTRVVRMVDGKNQTFVIEVSAITKRGEKDKDITLEPNDIVFVPESLF